MLYNLVRGPQVCQLFSCYVSPSINKVLTYLLTYLLTYYNDYFRQNARPILASALSYHLSNWEIGEIFKSEANSSGNEQEKNCVNSGLSITILPKISSIIQIRTVGADNYLNYQKRALPVTIEHGLPWLIKKSYNWIIYCSWISSKHR